MLQIVLPCLFSKQLRVGVTHRSSCRSGRPEYESPFGKHARMSECLYACISGPVCISVFMLMQKKKGKDCSSVVVCVRYGSVSVLPPVNGHQERKKTCRHECQETCSGVCAHAWTDARVGGCTFE